MIGTLLILLTYWRCQKLSMLHFTVSDPQETSCVCHMCEGMSHTETPLLVTAPERNTPQKSGDTSTALKCK